MPSLVLSIPCKRSLSAVADPVEVIAGGFACLDLMQITTGCLEPVWPGLESSQ